MPELLPENKGTSRMRRRIEYLEKRVHWYLFGLDWLASLGEFQHKANVDREPAKIFQLTRHYLKCLIHFRATAFYLVDEEDLDLVLHDVEPAAEKARVKRMFDTHIEKGTVSWAMNQNRPVIIQSRETGESLVFHVLATKSEVQGMFLGVVSEKDPNFNEGSNYLLSILMQYTANALESSSLYKTVSRQKDNLEEMVRERTQDLEDQALKLREEIAERKRAERERESSENLIRAVVDNVMAGIITIDGEGVIESFNSTAEVLFRRRCGEATGHNIRLLMTPAYREKYDWARRRYLETGVSSVIGQTVELEGLRSDGSIFPMELALSEMCVDGRKKFTGIIRDITERKESEAVIVRAREEADKANKRKSEFLASMSHEIRTPMNAIIGMTDLLEETSLTSEQKQCVRVFRSAGESLLELINDILDLAKIEAGSLKLESIDFNLHELAEKTVEIFNVRAGEKSIVIRFTMEPGAPLSLRGDPHRLRQILINLIGNALKFTKQGEILLRIGKGGDAGKNVSLRFSVSDSGMGIPADRLESIFDSFSQADSSTTRKYGGTGLGLAITKKLVELMGGRIWVESREGVGSTFSFTAKFEKNLCLEPRLKPRAEKKSFLENTRPPAKAGDPPAAQPFGKEKALRILLVDDSEDNRLLIQLYLRKTRHQLDAAVNGREAVEKFSPGKYDLILMDMQMPVMDGYTATQKIREMEKADHFEETPIIALTAHALKGDMEKCLGAGCSDYLTKPIKKMKIMETLEAYAKAPNPPVGES